MARQRQHVQRLDGTPHRVLEAVAEQVVDVLDAGALLHGEQEIVKRAFALAQAIVIGARLRVGAGEEGDVRAAHDGNEIRLGARLFVRGDHFVEAEDVGRIGDDVGAKMRDGVVEGVGRKIAKGGGVAEARGHGRPIADRDVIGEIEAIDYEKDAHGFLPTRIWRFFADIQFVPTISQSPVN